MNVSNEEKLMYRVMKAIFDSGIPISFKGSMVLKACLQEAGIAEETRHTVDIDANWNSSETITAEQMTESLQNALNQSNIDLKVTLYRMFGERRSAGFELKEGRTSETIFTMDVDVNRAMPPTKMYEIEGIRFCGVTPSQMMADKLYVLSTDSIFRRIKDLVDVYYLSKVFELKADELVTLLSGNGRELGNFDAFTNRSEELRRAYEKFRFSGDVNKYPFEEIYTTVKEYIGELISR